MADLTTPQSGYAAKLERHDAFQMAHQNRQTGQMRGGGNMLTGLAGNGVLPQPIQPQAVPAAPPAAMAAVPNAAAPSLLAQHAAFAQQRPSMTPQQVDHHRDRIGFLVHLIAPLVRKPGEVTRKDVANLVSDAVASGKFSPAEGANFMAGVPNDPAKIKQKLAEVLVKVVLTAIHLKGLSGEGASDADRESN